MVMHIAMRLNELTDFCVIRCHVTKIDMCPFRTFEKGLDCGRCDPFKELLHMLDLISQHCFNVGNRDQVNIPMPVDQILYSQLL